VSPTPLGGCQAQGVKVSKMKYDNKCNKVNNNAINYITMQQSKYDAVMVFLGFSCVCKKVNMFLYF
jgi:hypothetical protein